MGVQTQETSAPIFVLELEQFHPIYLDKRAKSFVQWQEEHHASTTRPPGSRPSDQILG
jgi:hypothetical protein